MIETLTRPVGPLGLVACAMPAFCVFDADAVYPPKKTSMPAWKPLPVRMVCVPPLARPLAGVTELIRGGVPSCEGST